VKTDLAFGLGSVYFSEGGGSEDSQQIFHELNDAAEFFELNVESIRSVLSEMRTD
jgi:hypothetical protein